MRGEGGFREVVFYGKEGSIVYIVKYLLWLYIVFIDLDNNIN